MTGRRYHKFDDDGESEDVLAERKRALNDFFFDISNTVRDVERLETDEELRESYKKKIVSWTVEPRLLNFVHEVLVHRGSVSRDKTEVLFSAKHKQFLLELAIPENFNQLMEQLPGSNGGTALHTAIESDPPFTALFCKSIEEGTKSGKLTEKQAGDILSQTNSKDQTCLHLALMQDLDVAETLIELADDDTFTKRRENGNTPLHDALELVDSANPKNPRYLTPAPTCKTPALRMPLDGFAPVAQPSNATQPSDCCNRCWEINQDYWHLKERRSRIVCALIRKCPHALTIYNNTGRSPFSHHVMAREDFKRKNPSFNLDRNQPKPETPLPDGPRDKKEAGVGTNTKVVQGGDNQNIDASIPLPPELKPQQKIEDCSLHSPRDWFHLSVEVEEMLWEEAFRVGGYEDARLCLFPKRTTDQNTVAEVSSEADGYYDVFIPTGRVTVRTKEHYANFKFMQTLAYVKFKVTPTPNVDKGPPTTPEAQAHWRDNSSAALEILFQWLAETKKVKRVLMLVIEDNHTFPCSETTIKNCLSMLDDVRYLNWRRPNISVQTLEKAKNITELWLYSTGINAVLSSWADQRGLQQLKQLRKVYIEAKPGMETKEANDENVKSFKDKLRSWYGETRAAPEMIDTFKLTSLTGRHVAAADSGTEANQSNPWLEKIKQLTRELKDSRSPKASDDDNSNTASDDDKCPSDYVKVALLDDGVDHEWDGMGEFMSGWGWPRPSEDARRHEQLESFCTPGPTGHGNRMAKLITTACPFVRLYVAKIDASGSAEIAHHPSCDIAQAIKALQWAIRMEVEVISMGWNVKLHDNHKHKRELEDAIRQANRKGILMFCAASEKKPTGSGNKVWPSHCQETFSIGAASDHRVAKGYVGSDARFLFPSDDDGCDGGSSAATALAAGLASLILYCLKSNRRQYGILNGRHAQQQPSAAGDDPRGMMEMVFGNLCDVEESSYVDIGKLVGRKSVSCQTIAEYCKPHIQAAK